MVIPADGATGPAAVLESSGSETCVFEPGAKIFLNRAYVLKEVSEAFTTTSVCCRTCRVGPGMDPL